MYPLALILRWKGNWLHEGSIPSIPTLYPEIIVNWLDWEAYIFARVGSNPTLRTQSLLLFCLLYGAKSK